MITIIPVLLFFSLCLPIGCFFLGGSIKGTWIPLYVGLGAGITAYTLLVIGFYHVSIAVPLLLSLSCIICLKPKIQVNFKDALPCALTLLSLHHFLNAVWVMQWPPIGDVISHATYVAMIQGLGKAFLTYAPYAPEIPAFYPLGFHALAATFSPSILGVVPGEAALLTAGMFIALIPPLMYVLTYMISDSWVLSILSYLSVFATYTKWRLFITGNFYLGVYPFLAGLTLILVYVCLIVAEARNQITPQRFVCLGTILSGAALFVYPSFMFFIAASLAIYLYNNQAIWRSKGVYTSIGLMALIVLSRIPLISVLNQVDFFSQDSLRIHFTEGNRVLVREFLTNSPNGWAILVSTIPAIYMIKKKEFRHFTTLYTLLLITVISSYYTPLFKGLLWPTLPNRSIYLLSLLSYIIIFTSINQAINTPKNSDKHIITLIIKGIGSITASKGKTLATCCLILGYGLPFYVLYPSLSNQFLNNKYPRNQKESWYVSDTRVWDMLAWVNTHIPSESLIMTDTTWTALWLPSYGVHNVTSFYLSAQHDTTRALAVKHAWEIPYNTTYWNDLIEKYNVSYIMITSDRVWFDWFYLNGTQNVATPRHFTPWEYIKVCDNQAFLRQVYREGDNAVYEVVR